MIEAIKEIKFYVDANQKELDRKKFIHNLTLYGTNSYEEFRKGLNESEKVLYDQLNPLKFFNLEIHDNLVIIFLHLLKPVFEELDNSLTSSTAKNLKTLKYFQDGLLIFYFISISFFYFLVLKRVENRVKTIIYRSKNMLLILPKKILVSLVGVQKLLEINLDAIQSHNEDEVNNN